MSERENFGDTWLASFFGGCFGVVAVVGYMVFELSGELYSSFSELLLMAILTSLLGLVLAQLSVVPLGALIGWMLTFRSEATWRKAAAGGTLTGTIAGFAVTANTLLDGTPSDALFVSLGAATIGCLSGLIGYRIVFHRPQRACDVH